MPRTVRDVMTADPAFCTPETSLEDVAKLMVLHECGEIPVVESHSSLEPIGVVTDRDMVCRLVARGKNPLAYTAETCMSQPVLTVSIEAPLSEAVDLMEKHQIRRVPVVDAEGCLVGIVAQADIAWSEDEREVGKMVREVSRDTGSSAR
ncbi:MAG: CBS domain-containing protein [Luteitalea sp.]|nr:CBS domain-containing protein [Luteitalea sp.]